MLIFFKIIKEYLYHFLNNKDFKARLLLAKKENVITAGGVFTLTGRIMQYHLSSTKFEYRKDAPMKLILDQARLIGIENNMDYLHLGGGVNGSSADSLFEFKAGFSDIRFVFSIWQLIVNEMKYSYLIDFFNIDRKKISNFFPVYRVK